MPKMKIVVKVPMPCDKCKTKVLTIAAKAHGVSQVSIKEDHLEVIGDDVDSVCLTKSLRKRLCCYSTVVKVEEVKPPVKPEIKPTPAPPVPSASCVQCCCTPASCVKCCCTPASCVTSCVKCCCTPASCVKCCCTPASCVTSCVKCCCTPASCVKCCCTPASCTPQFRPMYCELVHEYPEPTTCSIM